MVLGPASWSVMASGVLLMVFLLVEIQCEIHTFSKGNIQVPLYAYFYTIDSGVQTSVLDCARTCARYAACVEFTTEKVSLEQQAWSCKLKLAPEADSPIDDDGTVYQHFTMVS